MPRKDKKESQAKLSAADQAALVADVLAVNRALQDLHSIIRIKLPDNEEVIRAELRFMMNREKYSSLEDEDTPKEENIYLGVTDSSKFDKINKAYHYNVSPATCKNCGHQIECIDVVRHMSFNIGNAVKYLWRFLNKGAASDDLQKAIYYIKDEHKHFYDDKKPEKSKTDKTT